MGLFMLRNLRNNLPFKYIIFLTLMILFLIFGARFRWIQFSWQFIRGIHSLSLQRYETAYYFFYNAEQIKNPNFNLDPVLEDTVEMLAIQKMADNDYETALHWFDRIKQRISPSTVAYHCIALLSQGQEEKALAILNSYSETKSSNLEILVVWANYKCQKGSIEQTETLYDTAKAQFYNNPWVHIYFGDIFWIADKPDSAYQCYQKALELQDNHPVGLTRMGDWVMRWEKNTEKAKRFYMQSINTRTGFFCYDAYFKLSEIMGESGKKAPKPYFQRAKSLKDQLNRYTLKWLRNEALTNF